MTNEVIALVAIQTWELVPLPANTSVIGSKSVYSIKYKSDGSLDRDKERLTTQGFNQEYGNDYNDTFAPVAKMTSVRALLGVVVVRSCPLWQMDVKKCFSTW